MSFSFNAPVATETAAEQVVEQVETLMNNASEGETMKAKAVAFALEETSEMSTVIETVAKAKEDWQGGPIKVLSVLMETYGERLNEWPQPDDETSNNPDKFKIEVTGPDGKASMKQTSFYKEFTLATKEGVAISERIDWCKRSLDEKAIKDGIPDDIREMNAEQIDRHLSYLKGRLSTIQGSYKKAMALGFQLVNVNGMPGMSAEIVTDENGEPEATNKPIFVCQVPETGKRATKYKNYSIGAFIRLNVNKAIEKGGNLKALDDTLARPGASAPGGKDDNKVPAIKTVDTFVERFVDVYRFMDEMQMAKDQKDIGTLYKVLKAKDNDELIVSVVEFRNYLDDIAKELGLDKKYTAIQAKDTGLTNKAA